MASTAFVLSKRLLGLYQNGLASRRRSSGLVASLLAAYEVTKHSHSFDMVSATYTRCFVAKFVRRLLLRSILKRTAAGRQKLAAFQCETNTRSTVTHLQLQLKYHSFSE